MPKGAKKSGEAPAGIMAGSKTGDKKSVSKSQKAGLTFPVARINRFMKGNSGMKRIGGSAPVYMTAVLEYVTAEIMELAGNGTKKAGRKTVTPDDLTSALRGDVDLAKVFAGHGIFVGDKINKISETIKYTPASKPKKATAEEA
jgi:histone H2A